MLLTTINIRNWKKPVIFLLLVAAAAFLLGVLTLFVRARVVGVTAAPAMTVAERASFLRSFGWEITDEPLETSTVTIPSEFGRVYESYNDVQRAQGYNLERYKGKSVTRYTYEVKNYPSEVGGQPREHIRANLLVYEGTIIGGDICSLELGGFLHGFTPE